MGSDDNSNQRHYLEICYLRLRARIWSVKNAKAEHITTTGSENSGIGDELMTVKFLHIPAAPFVEASVSVTATLYGPAGSLFSYD
jgi:hypothetical protein